MTSTIDEVKEELFQGMFVRELLWQISLAWIRSLVKDTQNTNRLLASRVY